MLRHKKPFCGAACFKGWATSCSWSTRMPDCCLPFLPFSPMLLLTASRLRLNASLPQERRSPPACCRSWPTIADTQPRGRPLHTCFSNAATLPGAAVMLARGPLPRHVQEGLHMAMRAKDDAHAKGLLSILINVAAHPPLQHTLLNLQQAPGLLEVVVRVADVMGPSLRGLRSLCCETWPTRGRPSPISQRIRGSFPSSYPP
eukprot:jgi/Botrbrau1/7671/Bobra.0159s0113.1